MEFSLILHTIKSGWSVVYIDGPTNKYCIFSLKIDFVLANSADPDKMPLYAIAIPITR